VNATKAKKTSSQFARYLGPVMEALRELGGSGRPDEVREVIARTLKVSEAEPSETLPSGVQTRFENQVHWARFYLAKAGYIDSSQRGVWNLTEKGRSLGVLSADETQRIVKEVSAQTRPSSADGSIPTHGPGDIQAVGNYREELASVLQALPAAGFERFCQRLLRESGFQEVTVTGRAGDGGIDGIGILQIGPFITTGSFTSEARKEAVRDGAPPIELVDGEKLAGRAHDQARRRAEARGGDAAALRGRGVQLSGATDVAPYVRPTCRLPSGSPPPRSPRGCPPASSRSPRSLPAAAASGR